MRGTGFRVSRLVAATRVRNGARVSSLYCADAPSAWIDPLGPWRRRVASFIPCHSFYEGFWECFRCEDPMVISVGQEICFPPQQFGHDGEEVSCIPFRSP
jgi:hypothetical protein